MAINRATMRLAALVAVGAGVLLGSPASHAATNLAPNAGFELNCSGIPCDWFGGSTATWSTTNPHSGSASVQLTAPQPNWLLEVSSIDCVSVSPGTTYNLSVWYRTTAESVQTAQFSLGYLSGANCTGSLAGSGNIGAAPMTDGAWHQITGATTAPAGAQSARLNLLFACPSPGCAMGVSGNFDDVDMEAQSTAVTFQSLAASRTASGVLLHWRTASEVNLVGFNVYRQTGGRRVRVNAHLIPAANAVAGRRYSFLDRRAPAHGAIRYWIEAANTDGSRNWRGPVRVVRA